MSDVSVVLLVGVILAGICAILFVLQRKAGKFGARGGPGSFQIDVEVEKDG
ncbi:hypothetical protein [Pseudoroseicyclus sp. CXY001]|uniref:hypothetical protein n=1 Tax=Pseudoroseicyclus sp. CXY001 TaxID=3242492 RepID=UPI003570AE95